MLVNTYGPFLLDLCFLRQILTDAGSVEIGYGVVVLAVFDQAELPTALTDRIRQ